MEEGQEKEFASASTNNSLLHFRNPNNKSKSKELVGRAFLVEEDLNYAFNNYIARIRVNPELLMPEWLVANLSYLWLEEYFLKVCRKRIEQASVNTKMLKSIIIYIPPLEELNNNRKITEKETEAMTLTVLRKAFNGEL
jgi:restriction endonuclease S subunit